MLNPVHWNFKRQLKEGKEEEEKVRGTEDEVQKKGDGEEREKVDLVGSRWESEAEQKREEEEEKEINNR